MTFQEWWDSVLDFLRTQAPEYIFRFLGALIVLIIGWFIAAGVGRLVAELLKRLRFNEVFDRGGWKQALEKADLRVDPAGFVGAIFKWILVIFVLFLSVDILGLAAFSDFLAEVLGYIPHVIVAALIFVVAVLISDIAEKIIRATVEGARIGYSMLLGSIIRWAIWVFAGIAILVELGVAEDLLIRLFTGLVAFFVIAGGIAFGLGGKDTAAEILRNWREKMK
ncbi:MAG: hypothetical protein HYV77_00730 [Candidatus Wildermuthbacteria bacterium]|nr:hypothetical protein [Candidatus Wildermuthbacteria bacterium]